MKFFGKIILSVVSVVPAMAFASEEVATVAAAGDLSIGTGLKLVGAGLAIGLAVVGAGQGQGQAARGALESIGRNPQAYSKIFVPFLLAMALIEFQAILGLIISFLILGK